MFFLFEDKDYLLQSANMMKKYAKINKYEIVYNKNLELEKFYENNRNWTVRIKKL